MATDNASYSDMVFGPFKILGYNFSPRFRDLDDQRFWRATMPGVETGTYGALEDLARNRVNLNKVITHWPDMLKAAGSLVTNQVRAYDLLRMFGWEGRPAPLGAAFAEYGRIVLWTTRYIDAAVDHRPPAPCARCVTRTRPSWTRTTKAWTERPHRVTRSYQVAGVLGNRKHR
ncbi:Tn3 family transposase [Streptosporangium canum]|uniref:Tn3 family transposase n=1 Tax=Streptosporangium canum TaxID=324952 RepID=UPI003CCC3487